MAAVVNRRMMLDERQRALMGCWSGSRLEAELREHGGDGADYIVASYSLRVFRLSGWGK
jgi:hypothetical protein